MFESQLRIIPVDVPGVSEPVYIKEMSARYAWAVERTAEKDEVPEFALAIIASVCNEEGRLKYPCVVTGEVLVYDKDVAEQICNMPSAQVAMLVGAIKTLQWAEHVGSDVEASVKKN